MTQEILSRRLGRVAAQLRMILMPDEYNVLARKVMDVDAKFEDLTNAERIAVRKAEWMYDNANGSVYGAGD